MNRRNIDQNEGFCKNQTSCGPCVLPWASCKANDSFEKCPALQVVSQKPSMACLGRCVSTLHNQQPQALRCQRNIRFVHQTSQTSQTSPPNLGIWWILSAQGGARSQQQELTQRLDTALKTDMSNLVSALLLAPEAAAICKGLWPCLGDRVLGFSVHCGVGLVVTLVGVKWRIWCFPEVHLQGPLPVGLREQRATSICCKPGKEGFCPIWHFAILPSLPSTVLQFQLKRKRVRTKLSYTFARVFLSQNSRFTQHHKTSEDKGQSMWVFSLHSGEGLVLHKNKDLNLG